jgi:integrase/recombinase XerD
MANGKVNLVMQARDAEGRVRFYKVPLYDTTGAPKPGRAIINKVETACDGTYYLDWTEGDKRRRRVVGPDPKEAARERLKLEAVLAAKNNGVELAAAKDGRRTIADAAADFLEDTQLTKKVKTLAAYSVALRYFQESCRKTYVDEVDRRDLLKFCAFLRDKKEQAPRSVANKFENVMSFLKRNKVRDLIGKNDWPKFVEAEPEIYDRADLDKLFAACDDEERLWYEFFLMTGMREQEVQHTYWSDINLQRRTVSVSHKPDRNWSPKMYRARTIPVPQKLVDRLREFKGDREDRRCELVFPTKGGCNVRLDFLDRLKVVAERAGLNPDDCWLHKFRSSFATYHLWSGVDLRTVQSWCGHSDLESTLRYLKPQHFDNVRSAVDKTWT